MIRLRASYGRDLPSSDYGMASKTASQGGLSGWPLTIKNYKVGGRKESEVSGQRSGLKANARFWRLRRQRGRINYVHHALQNRHDDRFMNVESLFQFLF